MIRPDLEWRVRCLVDDWTHAVADNEVFAERATEVLLDLLAPLLNAAEEMRAGLDVSMNVSLAGDYDKAREALLQADAQ